MAKMQFGLPLNHEPQSRPQPPRDFWVVDSAALGEKILVVQSKDFLYQARRVYPGLPTFVGPEIDELSAVSDQPEFLRAVLCAKKFLGGWVKPGGATLCEKAEPFSVEDMRRFVSESGALNREVLGCAGAAVLGRRGKGGSAHV